MQQIIPWLGIAAHYLAGAVLRVAGFGAILAAVDDWCDRRYLGWAFLSVLGFAFLYAAEKVYP